MNEPTLVVGAGPAGLEAARAAAERGHSVEIVEALPVVGGQFRLAGDANVHVARLDDTQLALFIAQGHLIVRVRVLDGGEAAKEASSFVPKLIVRASSSAGSRSGRTGRR